MNKHDFKYLIRLNSDIDKACKILGTNRSNFLTQLQIIFEAASFGMEMNPSEMVNNGSSSKTPRKGGRASPNMLRKKNLEEASRVALQGKEMNLAELIKVPSIKPHLNDVSDGLKTMWNVMNRSKLFEKVPKKKGFYRLRSKK